MVVWVADFQGKVALYRLLAEMGKSQLGCWLKVDEGVNELPAHSLVQELKGIIDLVKSKSTESMRDCER